MKQRGRPALPEAQKRAHCVSVRMNVAELATLDKQRGKVQRGEWLRMMWAGSLPLLPAVPPVDQGLIEIGRRVAALTPFKRWLAARLGI